ncbi:hypothetical protein KDH_66990 [Dictyobacter sp. S3.2.2.5]|uniref:Uncharacterized protein n=1 Tax=Dictyobacter halimunensis TaxID=3026934 RepID=A0ABQ6G1V8_9CHLR|nr:hypothetical protein KDH_66990 [Dictyobacter sp. S3.2.2.5]
MGEIHVFGIRHHGPGCARSLRAALEKLKPDILLIEGPPDAQAVLPLMEQPKMKPPVALLIYAPEQPKKAVYYPFTQFSPEWQALKYAQKARIPARFMDLPQSIQLARVQEGEQGEELEPAAPTTRGRVKKALKQGSIATSGSTREGRADAAGGRSIDAAGAGRRLHRSRAVVGAPDRTATQRR